jgi:YD repeat-containing protein
LSGWFNTPAQILTGGSTGGKARFAPDGLRLAKTDGARVLLWNLQSTRTNFLFTGHGAEVTTLQLLQEFTGSAGTIGAVAVCPEGLALAGNSDRFAVVWNIATGQILCRLTNHTKLITAAAFLPGGTNAMTASLDGTIRIWDTTTGTERFVLQQGSPVVDASLSLDGRLLVSCYDGNPLWGGNGPIGTAYIWDAQSGALVRVLSDETAPSQMKGIAISPDHTALATTYADGSVRLWNTGLEPCPIYPVTPLGIGTNSPVTLRSHGLYYFAVDAEAGRSLVLTLEADPGGGGGSKLKWSADIPVRFGSGLSTDAEFANLGVPQADKNVRAPKSLQTPPPGADLTAPLFVVSTPTERNWLYPLMPTSLVLPLNPAQKRPAIQTMAPNPYGPVQILAPGARSEIPLYFQGDGSVATMPFKLCLFTPRPDPIDWASLQSQLRPPDMAADLWGAIWANLLALIGNTWADYSRALAVAAFVHANSGQATVDVAELLAYHFSEAVGAPYRRTLFATVDASAPAPALPRQFARFTTDGLEHRFSLGPLGRGWSHNYEYTLTQPASDKIIIRTPGGGGRRFDRGSDYVWRGQAGDYGTLAVGAGWFVLTEKDALSRQFDASDLLISVEEPNRNRVTLSYSGSQLIGLAHSAGPSFTLQYNGQGRLARLTDHAGQVTDYEYDPAGSVNTWQNRRGQAIQFTRNAQGRLTRETKGNGTSASYTYDLAGQMVAATNYVALAGTNAGAPILSFFNYTYDAKGNRIAVVHDGVTNRFLHDPVGLVDVAAEFDATGALVSRYDHAIGLVSRTDGAGSAFNSFDALGNTRELTGDAAAVLNSYDYDAFGAATVVDDVLPNSYRFVGKFAVSQDS